MKIPYMKVWPKKYGSPFTKGGISNNWANFISQSKFSNQGQYLYPWEMPKKMPKL
jgi:hypothetical protein